MKFQKSQSYKLQEQEGTSERKEHSDHPIQPEPDEREKEKELERERNPTNPPRE